MAKKKCVENKHPKHNFFYQFGSIKNDVFLVPWTGYGPRSVWMD